MTSRFSGETVRQSAAAGSGSPTAKPADGFQLAAYNPQGASTSEANALRFAHGLQRAGYATDPAYADKLTRVINTTLRLQRVVT